MTAVPLGTGATGLGSDARLLVQRSTRGTVLVSSPDAPGWQAAASTATELARALEEGFREAACAAYAQQRGERYDLALHDQAAGEAAQSGRVLPIDPDARDRMLSTLACSVPPTATVPSSAAVHDPLAWTPLPDGRWVSPSGRRYGGETQVVARIIEKRAAMGVDTGPGAAASET